MTMTRMLVSFFRIAAVTFALTFVSPSASHAQGFISPFIGYDFGGDSGCPEVTDCEDRNLNLGVSFGSLGLFGSELEISYARDFFGEIPGVSSSVLTVMGNVMVAPRFGPVQPYGVIGLGLIKTNVEFSTEDLLEFDNNHFGWDIGGGVIVYLGQHFGVRGDIRYFHSFRDLDILGITIGETKLDFGRASAGVVLRF
jgi:opacity protein-like surface antigen